MISYVMWGLLIIDFFAENIGYIASGTWDIQYNLPIQQVIEPVNGETANLAEAAFTEKGNLINSGDFTGLTSQQAFNKIAEHLSQNGKGKKTVNYRLRDWGFHASATGELPSP